ncbi:MAG: outer membrane lipoprotein-sorting protein [Treponema sp.]|jgi:hypothetical protein|nr:MAG: hypothetical protein BWY39_02035 [Spirochaetes bacterium ADurb.Bin269]TAH55504.1 MAG: outer membrane lipoprotein-sorting protein [Treponema sp.]
MNHASIASIAPSHPLRERATANSRTVLALAALVAAAASFGTPLAAQTKQGNAPASTPASGSGDAIIVKMEQIMFPDTKTVMRLESLFDGKKETYEMTSFTRDNNQKVIVRFSAPASMIGSDLLMLDRNVWLYDPKSAREMKIPSNQSFGGTGFSYGDVLRLNYSDNYSAAVLAETETSWTLDLSSKQRDAPYHRIVLEVSRAWHPVSGKCYSRSGELVKEMHWSKTADAGGGVKPLVVTVTSPLDPKDRSVLTIVSETLKTYPPNIFNKKNLSARMEAHY